MKRYLVAPLLAALAMFVVGFLYWGMPASPAYKAYSQLADDDAAAQALAKIFPATGTYLLPGMYLDEAKMTQLYERGPSAQVIYVKEGHGMEPMVFVKGFLHYFVVALLLMMLLTTAAPALACYSARVKFTAAVGLVGALMAHLSDPIWGHHPLAYHLVCGLYLVVEFTVAGLILAKFSAPPAIAADPVRSPEVEQLASIR